MMTDEQTPEEREFLRAWEAKRRRRRRRIWMIVGGIVLLLILAGVIYDRYWTSKLDARVAQLRAKGRLVTFQQMLDRDKELPPDRNSALVFMRAFQQLQDLPAVDVAETLLSVDAIGDRPSEPTLALLGAQGETRSQGLQTILSAQALTEGCYPLKPARTPWDLLLPHCSAARHAAKLCAQAALLRTASGQPAQATAHLMAGLGLASSFGQKPFLIEELVRMACDRIMQDALEQCLGLSQFSSDDLQKLRTRLQRERDALSMDWPLIYERSSGEFIFEHITAEGLPEREFGHVPGGRLYAWVPGWRQGDALFYNNCMDELDRLCALPPREALAEAKGVSESFATRMRAMTPPPVVCAMVLPALSRLAEGEIQSNVELSVAAAALAVEQYRLKNGRWPEGLDELVPEFLDAVPEDYFGTGKIVYRKTETGVVLYSVGPDGKDDGGVTVQEAVKSGPSDAYDLPFRLFSPDLRGAKTASFRDEVVDSGVSLDDLRGAGLDEAALKRAGLSEDDLAKLRGDR